MKKILVSLGFLLMSSAAFAGFASNEVYLASIGRGAGSGGAQFYSTIWVTNLSSSATVHFTFTFLNDGQSNLSGAPSFNDTLAPGQTRLYENVTETKLNLPGQFGAARITADGEIFASERVYNLETATADLGTSEGLFFAAVPKSFAIGLGETASVQGINQGAPTENMRTNFDLVETTGNSCKVHVTLLDPNGASQGAADVTMQPYGHVKESVAALLPSVNTINARVVATVTSGSGNVILAGEQLANTSQDSSGFEMSFKDSLLGSDTGGNCGVCVTSVNGLSGAVTIAAGSNVTLNKSGQTITIGATGGGGGLTLPFTGSSSTSPTTFAVSNTGTGQAIEADSNATGGTVAANPFAIKAVSTGATGTGVYGSTLGTSGEVGYTGVWGDSHDATALTGTSFNDRGVLGISSASGVAAVEGLTRSPSGTGVLGRVLNGSGTSLLGNYIGVWGDAPDFGVVGTGDTGVRGESASGTGVTAHTGSSSKPAFSAYNSGGGDIAIFQGGGSSSARIDNSGKGFFDGGTQTGGADVAEFISGSAPLGPGDVVEIDLDRKGTFRLSSRPNSTAVAGVISTDPGVTMNARGSASQQMTGPQLALAGRVPVKVTAEGGPIHPGDLLVASSIPGRAMRAPDAPGPGTIIGKALGDLTAGEGVIEMLVMLR